MKRILLAAIAVLSVSTAAQAADPFANAYGNTVTQVLPDGTKMITYINADMTWEQHVGEQTMKGTYAWKDASHACFTLTDPAPTDPAQATSCTEIKGEHNVGDTWTEMTADGKTITISLSAGR
ncbi:MAG: hypothetical protein KGJ28_13345 [Alphaproteobacteria bacterium]|nr:hypothetical protein [Alphaproteobacteria bacterium]